MPVDNGSAAFLLNARGSLVELTPEEAELVEGGSGGGGGTPTLLCTSYSNANGCDYTVVYDP